MATWATILRTIGLLGLGGHELILILALLLILIAAKKLPEVSRGLRA